MSEDSLIGTVLADRYRVDRLIGEGAMGRVYEAEHILMRKRVALKVLHQELMSIPEIVQRFEREARAAAHIEHAHVAGATDFGKLDDGKVYLILEFIEGVPLTDVIDGRPMKAERAMRIARQVVSALEAAHAQGIVHRDLKPDNLLLLHDDDKPDFVKVLDFGIAKVPTEPTEGGKPITQVGMVYGTPEYMAPEQALGQDVDGRADLYAVGVILYEMLTGRRPYVGPAVGLLGQQLSSPLPKMGRVAKVKVPPALEQLVVELLVPDVNKRLADAKTVREQLDALITAFEEGRLGGADNRGGSLLSVSFEDVTTRIENVADILQDPVERAVKSRVSKVALLTLLFGAVGVIGAIVMVGAVVEDPESKPGAVQLELTEPPPPVIDVPEKTPVIDPEIEQAREKGIDALQALAEKYPNEGSIRAEVALAMAKGKRYEEAVDWARLALTIDPKLNEDSRVMGALFRSAQSPKSRAATYRLLKGPMGPAGVGIIYDLARTESLKSSTKKIAEYHLKSEEARKSAGPALLLVLELEEAKTCEELALLVKRAALVGDKRALPALGKLEATEGCGRRKTDDCYPCLREGGELQEAIATIKQRVTLTESKDEGDAGKKPAK